MFMDRINEPFHEILIFITYATSDGSDEPAHPCILARAVTVRTHKLGK